MSKKLQFLLIGVGILIAMEWRAWAYYFMPPPDYSQGGVILYATDWCPYCEKTRALLQQKHITYKEMNIETSDTGRTQYQRLAGKGVPVLLVAGEVVRGYNEQRIRQVLDAWQANQALHHEKENKANR